MKWILVVLKVRKKDTYIAPRPSLLNTGTEQSSFKLYDQKEFQSRRMGPITSCEENVYSAINLPLWKSCVVDQPNRFRFKKIQLGEITLISERLVWPLCSYIGIVQVGFCGWQTDRKKISGTDNTLLNCHKLSGLSVRSIPFKSLGARKFAAREVGFAKTPKSINP